MQCTAHRKVKNGGTPCKAPAVRGGNVCIKHGGKAPQVQAAAKIRLAALVDPSIAVYDGILKKAKYAISRNRPNSIYLQQGRMVAKDVFALNGLTTPQEVQLSGPGGGPLVDLTQLEGADDNTLDALGRIFGAALAKLAANADDEGPDNAGDGGDSSGASS